MSDKIPLPTLKAILHQIEIEKIARLITDAERNKVFDGKTDDEQLLLLSEVLDGKRIKYRK